MSPSFDTHTPAPREVALPMASAYVEQLGWRSTWFRDRVSAAGGPPVDGTVESLDPLAAFVAARVHDPGPVTAEPYWFQAPEHRPDWTEAGAEWVEGLASAIAGVIVGATGAAWVFDTDTRYATGHQPVLLGIVNTPGGLASGAVGDVVSDRVGRPLSRLVPRMIDQYDPTMRRLAQAPRLTDGASTPLVAARHTAPIHVDVTPPTGGRWDAQVSLPEDIEDLLGPAAYASLEERFAAVPGVREVVFEDRDLAVLATDLGPDDLAAALDAVLAELFGQR